MRKMALIGLAVVMAFILATPALYAQQGSPQPQQDTQQQQQGQFVCPWTSAGQAGAPCPHQGRMGRGHRMMGNRCMMGANNMPANCPRLTNSTATPPAVKQ